MHFNSTSLIKQTLKMTTLLIPLMTNVAPFCFKPYELKLIKLHSILIPLLIGSALIASTDHTSTDILLVVLILLYLDYWDQ